jgi:type IV secretion system protein VirB1
MPLALIDMQHLAATCAPSVAPQTLLSVAKAESGFDTLAIGVNRPRPISLHPRSADEAIATATRLIASGANIDLGVAQINSSNLAPLGLSIADAFDPCRNLAASAKLMVAGYGRASLTAASEQAAVLTSLSLYNTGDAHRGFRNGYVARVVATASQVVPALAPRGDIAPMLAAPSTPPAPSWDVFGQTAPSTSFVLSPTPSGDDR